MERICLNKKRVKLFQPKLDKYTLKWIQKIAWKSKWAIAPWYELDDLVQDGCMIFYKCRDKFTRIPDLPPKEERRRFMAYFMTAFKHHIYDLGKDNVQTVEDTFSTLIPDGAEEFSVPGDVGEEESVTLSTMIAQAPADIAAILGKLQNEGMELLRTRMRHAFLGDGEGIRVKYSKRRKLETPEERFTRLTGRPDAFEMVRDYVLGVK